MKIKIVAHIINEEGAYYPEDIVHLRDELAVEWIKQNWALPIRQSSVETATVGPPEAAVPSNEVETESLAEGETAVTRGRGRPRKNP